LADREIIYYTIQQEVALKIVVCVKQVPDTAAKVVVENGQVTWGDAPLVNSRKKNMEARSPLSV
jgi:hypothetical protein